jgi:RNA polymerase sigma factor (sigma-70 family)
VLDNLESYLENYKPLLKKIARHFTGKNASSILDENDYYQQACLGLILSYNDYDKNRGDFSTFLLKVIPRYLSKYAALNSSNLKVNHKIIRLSIKIHKLENEGYSVDDILNKLRISYKKYILIKPLLSKSSLKNTLFYKDTDMNIYDDMKSVLTEDEYNLLLLSINLDIKEISQQLGYSYEWTRLKINRLFAKIKEDYA